MHPIPGMFFIGLMLVLGMHAQNREWMSFFWWAGLALMVPLVMVVVFHVVAYAAAAVGWKKSFRLFRS